METSKPLSVALAVPQGSILDPLFFLIYIDDITKLNLSVGTKLILYADDLLLYRPLSKPQDFDLLQGDKVMLMLSKHMSLLSICLSMRRNVSLCWCLVEGCISRQILSFTSVAIQLNKALPSSILVFC